MGGRGRAYIRPHITCVSVCMWSPDVFIRYSPLYALRKGLLLNLELAHCINWVARNIQIVAISDSPTLQLTGMCHRSQHVTWMLVVGTQYFMLTWQALGWQNYLPKKVTYLCFLNWGLRSGMWGGKAVGVGSGEGRGCLIIRETSEGRHMKRSLAYQQRCCGNTHQTWLEFMCKFPHLISTAQYFISI